MAKIHGEVAAATFAFKTKDSLLLYNSGFDGKKFTGAGFYLKAMGVKLVIEKGLKTYNFLQGNYRYKYELGGKDFFVYKASLIVNV
jgi:hypothetical protein